MSNISLAEWKRRTLAKIKRFNKSPSELKSALNRMKKWNDAISREAKKRRRLFWLKSKQRKRNREYQ